jgi:hypothetical protein
MWLGGGMLYLWIIALIFYRYTFFTMSPSDLAPPYWINMGAAAISTLAGTLLVAAAPHSPVLEQVLPFVRGLTLLWWATATWWIPMLLILGRGGTSTAASRCATTRSTGAPCSRSGCTPVCTVRLSRAVDAPYLVLDDISLVRRKCSSEVVRSRSARGRRPPGSTSEVRPSGSARSRRDDPASPLEETAS